ncbi:UDP-N-acetylmuramoyl-L-alanine--D-glutamate ligase [soil metagenome]
MIPDWKNKKVAIVGIGVEGLSSAAYLKEKGAAITFLDKRNETEFEPATLQEARSVSAKQILGEKYLADLAGYEMIVRSPGVKVSTPQLQAAKKNGVVLTSQTQLFLEMCPGKVIGVTGTKGKGTTSSLIYEMLKKQGYNVYLGGNIGKPPFTFLDRVGSQSWVVLELSSFQLQDLTISPHIAVMLMVTSEHLDYHQDTLEYVQAKRQIIAHQTSEDFAVLNRDYPASQESDILTEGKVFWVSRERETDNGCYGFGNKIYIKRNGFEEELLHTDEILLPGKHNVENACAATMAAILAGVSRKHIVSVLKEFPGLEHRLELVREVDGVRYYDDSFSTTPETAIAAIEAFNSPEILILGGSSKSSDFSLLGEVISDAENIKAVIGIGKEWQRIKEALKEPKIEFLLIEGADTMEKIVQATATISVPGDVVILSPACASFDMFKNYKDRGEQFKKEVMKLGKN